MKTFLALTALALVAGCASGEPVDTSADAEAALAAELRDYEQAGPPVSCVNMRNIAGNRSVGSSAIIFEGQTGGRLFVNRPPAGCPVLNHGRALQTRTITTQLCRGDIATVFDPVSGASYGGCGLGDFTPYRRRGS
jgi:hypothetical protein